MGVSDAINKIMSSDPDETEEEKKKRKKRELERNPLNQLARRKSTIDQAVEDAQK